VLSLSIPLFSQSSNATLSGTVSDAAKALIPGVSLTAKNTETNVTSTAVSNESGAYNISGLLPGTYTVTAELPGFQTQTFTDVRLGNAAQARLNFTLQVASLNQTVEVTVSADRLLIESTSSVGAVLPERAVRELPIVGAMGNDAISLVRTLPGVNLASDLILAANDSKLAGVSAANVNVQRDGVDASGAGRWPAGLQGATVVNPDLVGEIRMVISPVDAEIGGGNAQVQIQTRSGTNRYRGSAVWNIRNSVLDGNTWANNKVQPVPPTRSWTNINQYTASMGGPIIKNKTFFFALWDGLLPAQRLEVNSTVLTPCATRGIFRYFDNWSNGNSQQVESGGATPRIAVVDYLGNPVKPDHSPTGGAFTGQLRYASVFGPLAANPTKADCSDAVVQGSPWDPNRKGYDPTGYVQKVLNIMPVANNYEIGDGLNTAGHRWVRSTRGGQNRFGFGVADVRKQLNTKIDHNFNARNKVSGTWTFERIHSDYGQTPWDTVRFDGTARRKPQVLSVNYTSTISPSIVNEVRWGMRRTGTNTIHGLALNDDAKKFVPNVQGIPVVMQLGLQPLAANGQNVVCWCSGAPLFQGESNTLFNGNIGEKTNLYTYNDTLSWTKGVHTFKGGFEARYSRSELKDDVDSNSWSTYARAFGGETQYTPIQGINTTNMPGLQGTATTGNVLAARALLTLLSGSLAEIHQLYWLNSSQKLDKFDSYLDNVQRTRQLNQNEYSAFFKDDWKVTRNVTLNAGPALGLLRRSLGVQRLDCGTPRRRRRVVRLFRPRLQQLDGAGKTRRQHFVDFRGTGFSKFRNQCVAKGLQQFWSGSRLRVERSVFRRRQDGRAWWLSGQLPRRRWPLQYIEWTAGQSSGKFVQRRVQRLHQSRVSRSDKSQHSRSCTDHAEADGSDRRTRSHGQPHGDRFALHHTLCSEPDAGGDTQHRPQFHGRHALHRHDDPQAVRQYQHQLSEFPLQRVEGSVRCRA